MQKAILVLCCLATAYGQQRVIPADGIIGAGPNDIADGPGQAGVGIGPGGPGFPGGLGVGGMSQLREPQGEGAPQGGSGFVGYGPGQGQLDLFTLLLRQIALAYGADPLRLPETSLPFNGLLRMSGTVHTYNSYVFGLSHVVRTGPCFVTADHTGMRLRLDLGISNVYGNSSATVKMGNSKMNKHRVRFNVFVRQARAILEIAQSGPHNIQVTNFKITFLKGFKLFLKPEQPTQRPFFRAFLRAAEAFLDRSVRKRLEPLVRTAIDRQIKTVLVYLNRQAKLRPRPRLPAELFANVPQDILIGSPQSGGFPSEPGFGRPGAGGPGARPIGGPGVGITGGPSGVGGGAGQELQGIGVGGSGFGSGPQLPTESDVARPLSGPGGQQQIVTTKGL
uniref:Putative glycine rich protein n=1 Tax=Rhipicephalus pulchellus TaxID=72859 RepID=L7M1K6_RHIPC